MLTRHLLFSLLATLPFAAAAGADPVVYVVTGAKQFGTVDLTNGAFRQIGPNTPEGESGLAAGPNGSLLTLTFSGKLDSVNPSTGLTSVIGPTGLGDCSSATSLCGPTSPSALTALGGTLYATDYQNNLYRLNAGSGKATLVGPTGMPGVTFVPLSTPNSDGSLNFYGEALFGANGKLYATFDTGTINFQTGVVTPVIANNLYQIDPSTGARKDHRADYLRA